MNLLRPTLESVGPDQTIPGCSQPLPGISVPRSSNHMQNASGRLKADVPYRRQSTGSQKVIPHQVH